MPKSPPSESAVHDLARDGKQFADWYQVANRELKTVCRLAHWTRRDFASVLAITSPRVSVRRNVRVALHYMLTSELISTTMRSTRIALAHWEETGEIRGPKTSAFCEALLDPHDNTGLPVLDVWMARALAIPQKELGTARRYEVVGRSFSNTPRSTRWRLHDFQAAVWAGTMIAQGRTPGYYPLLAEYNRLTSTLPYPHRMA